MDLQFGMLESTSVYFIFNFRKNLRQADVNDFCKRYLKLTTFKNTVSRQDCILKDHCTFSFKLNKLNKKNSKYRITLPKSYDRFLENFTNLLKMRWFKNPVSRYSMLLPKNTNKHANKHRTLINEIKLKTKTS